ncbi:cation:proton antiporter [Reyranella sp.]|uniref:cation:proton antiporter domain-containing protein n=1 Tax=Reyranella sp. TaxID=1929291 RepID=UPI003BA92B4D
MEADHSIAVFAAELILLLFFGRALGEGMTRLGQPAIFGQLLAGVLLGPSVFGALLPEWRQVIFPDTPKLKSMIDAVSQIGILLLLLLTGMETNLALVNRRRRAVVSSSLFGIAIPFACGVGLAYALPASLIPSDTARLVTALFLGTALSISSVKIVAMVLLEVGAIRRDLGQLILATAILDDTLAWIIIAVISGIAAKGVVSFEHIGISLGLTAVFLGITLTVGKRLVARLIVWCNDNLTIEVPVVSAILLIMLAMALTTELIGVHTALGAFIAGLLVGQSPILTEHIEDELRGFIVAFFSPVFFAVAGLGMDLRTLLDPTLLGFTVVVILIASIGKSLGALAGGLAGGLTWKESLAMATGLNARGSTEVLIASIGLAMGALSSQLYTMIVAMAIVTTMAMPPTLRWMMARVPLRPDEAQRLEKETAEENEALPRIERALAVVDDSANGRLAASLTGLFVARQGMLTTLLEISSEEKKEKPEDAADASEAAPPAEEKEKAEKTPDKAPPPGRARLAAAFGAVISNLPEPTEPLEAKPQPSLDELVQARLVPTDHAIDKEVTKGYGIALVGLAQPISATAPRFEEPLGTLVASFDGPIATVVNGRRLRLSVDAPLDILVPTGGSPEARLATEFALALAGASRGTLTVLHVFDPREETLLLRGRARRLGMSLLVDARRLGRRSGVPVKGLTATSPRPDREIARELRRGRYDLVVLGTAFRRGDGKFLGPRTLGMIQSLAAPVLVVAR